MDEPSAAQMSVWEQELQSDDAAEISASEDSLSDYEPFQDEDVLTEQEVSSSDEFERESTAIAIPYSRKRSHSQSDLIAPTYLGKDKTTKWIVYTDKKPSSSGPPSALSDIKEPKPGPKGSAKDARSVLSCWSQYFSDDVLTRIVICTNQKLVKLMGNYKDKTRPTDIRELKAFIGLLYLLGAKKCSRANIDDLWSSDGTAPEIYRAVMSLYRFQLLMRAIRFDYEEGRTERRMVDNLAPIREVFENFVTACNNCFSLTGNVTVGSIINPFRGKCKFRVCKPNKFAKAGIKMYALCDSELYYTANLEVYAGNQPWPLTLEYDATSVVKRLIQPIDRSGRNITMSDNYMSVPLANDLIKNHLLTSVGAVRMNAPEVPAHFIEANKAGTAKSIHFAHGLDGNDCTLMSHKTKGTKVVLLLTTLCDKDAIEGSCQKPELLEFYEKTKKGVDAMDKLRAEYSVNRISNRWPLAMFFAMLNIGAINAQIIYSWNTGVKCTRRNFLRDLAFGLFTPNMVNRLSTNSLPFETRIFISRITNTPLYCKRKVETNQDDQNKRKKCSFCKRSKNHYTKSECGYCCKMVCREHTSHVICIECSSALYCDD